MGASHSITSKSLPGETIGLSSGLSYATSAKAAASKRLSTFTGTVAGTLSSATDLGRRGTVEEVEDDEPEDISRRTVGDKDNRDLKNAQKTLQNTEGQRYCIAMSGTGQLVGACGPNSRLVVWNIDTGAIAFETKSPWGTCNSISLSADGSKVAFSGRDGKARVHDISRGIRHEKVLLASGDTYIRRVCLNHNGSVLAALAQDCSLQLFDANRGTCTHTLQGHKGTPWSIAMNNSGSHCVTCSADGAVLLWDLERHRIVASFSDSRADAPAKFWCVAMSSNIENTIVAAAAEDCSVRVWSVNSNLQIAKLRHQQWVWSVAIHVSGDRVASCGGHLIYVWDVMNTRVLQCFHVPTAGWVWSVTISHQDVSGLASDGSVWVWDVDEGSVKRTLRLT